MASSISTQWRQAQRKERLSLSLSFTNRSMSPNDGNATSSSDISAGPLTPDDDDHDSRLDSYSFFTQPSKAPRPPHLFSLYEADNEDSSPVEAEMPSPVEQSILPSSISSFDILGTLGRGTYGKVLLGINPGQLGALRAIKTIKKSGIHPYGLEEIEREIRTLHKISAAAKSEPGRSFVQNMFSSFTNEEYAFLVLVRLFSIISSAPLILYVGIPSHYTCGSCHCLAAPSGWSRWAYDICISTSCVPCSI